MKLLNFSIIKLTVCLALGILIGNFMTLPISITLSILSVSVLTFIVAYVRAHNKWQQDALFGSITFLLFIAIGLFVYQQHQPQHNKQHFINNAHFKSNTTIESRVVDVLKPYSKFHNYIVEVASLNRKPTEGRLLVKVATDTLTPSFKIDDRLVFNAQIENIPKPLNPQQFDYANYMRHQKVLAQVKLDADKIIVLQNDYSTIIGFAARIRNQIVTALEKEGFNGDELSIIKALLLGQRDDISKDVYNNYAAAGVIHILAVSGLHVGIILAILQLVLSPISRLRYGNFFKIGIIVLLLWSFAVIAGLSPSILRAVTMFSFYAIALNLKRRTSTLNVLFLSALILLLINPELLFQIGFQLSYLAVFSIVILQPILYSLINRPKNFILRLLWGVFTVTIAAQVGVFALSLFYFHQFPGLFFITNVLIIPFLGIILSYGILCITMALLGWLPEIIQQGYSAIIYTMNNVIAWVAKQDGFVLRDIHFSELQVILTYLLIFASLFAIRNFKPRKVIYVLAALLIMQVGFIYEKHATYSTSNFIVFHATAESAIGLQKKGRLYIKTGKPLPKDSYLKRTIQNYAVGAGLAYIQYDSLKNVYNVFDKHLLVVDSIGVYSSNIKSDIVLLRNSPKLNLNRLIDSLSPKLIIADGSNYNSYISRWKETSKRKKLPFHHTGEKGAFLIQD